MSEGAPAQVRVSIVMLHYVRPLHLRWSPSHSVLDLARFSAILDQLRLTHRIVTSSELAEMLRTGEMSPVGSKPLVWLTFDDGYSDCMRFVAPELLKRNMRASFFVPTQSIWERRLLEVNAVQYLLALSSSAEDLVMRLKSIWLRKDFRTTRGESFDAAFSRLAQANDWNDQYSEFAKKVLQRDLPRRIRTAAIAELLEGLGRGDLRELADDLYLRPEELRELEEMGMEVGSHGHEHVWLSELDPDSQRADLEVSLALLESAGLKKARLAMSYPFSSYDSATLSHVKALGVSFGLVNDGRAVAHLQGGGPWLEVSRVDVKYVEQVFALP